MRRIVLIIVIISSFFVINNLIASIIDLYQKQDLLVRAKDELESEKRENQKLRAQLNLVKDPAFIEQEARDKLLLVKPGEQIVVLGEQDTSEETPVLESKPKKHDPNWVQWWELFFRQEVRI